MKPAESSCSTARDTWIAKRNQLLSLLPREHAGAQTT